MGYQENAGHFSLGTGWEQILKFVLHTNKLPGSGQLNCLAFQKFGRRERWQRSRGTPGEEVAGIFGVLGALTLLVLYFSVCGHCFFFSFSWIKTTETCVWAEVINNPVALSPSLPSRPYLMTPKVLFLAENPSHWQWSGKVCSLKESGAVKSGTVAFEPALPKTVEFQPCLELGRCPAKQWISWGER